MGVLMGTFLSALEGMSEIVLERNWLPSLSGCEEHGCVLKVSK